jgi:hypothetical protein
MVGRVVPWNGSSSINSTAGAWGGSDVKVRRLARPAVAALGLVLALGAAEVAARLGRLDQRLLTPMLYFQAADLPVHRVSADPVLHYELAPGTSCDCETDGRKYRVTIDASGARYPTHPATKGPGVFRILCAGGSTIYGGSVADDHTMPAAVERRLNAAAPAGKQYEAWNFGTPAYTLRQAAHLARARLDTLHPDLVLVQLHNRGRRAYLIPASMNGRDYPWSAIVADPELFQEQISVRYWLPRAIELPLLRHSAFARAGAAALPGFEPNSRGCAYCDAMDHAEAAALSHDAKARGIPVIYFAIPADQRRVTPDDNVYPGLPPDRLIDLHRPNREPAFYEVHPPPAILDELAQILIAELRARGLPGPGVGG